MTHRVLIIDDEKLQVNNIRKVIEASLPDFIVDVAFDEKEIKKKISETYFNVAIVDLRMDSFTINGFDIIRDIIEINPFAKIIVCSAYLAEYSDEINELIKSGKVNAILSKEKFDVFSSKILSVLNKIVSDYDRNVQINQQALEYLYSDAKNAKDTFQKGKRFEYFVTTLFSQMGFSQIMARAKDKSYNEVDLIIRNDIKDLFFSKFKPYLLIECKNELENIDKNQFITFRSKLEHTNGLANLGFMLTPKGFKRSTYLEALRSSATEHKIVFISNSEIEELIRSESALNSLKKIIDFQVKDN
jgi:DNA-binding NarL/FixJ family response regulator